VKARTICRLIAIAVILLLIGEGVVILQYRHKAPARASKSLQENSLKVGDEVLILLNHQRALIVGTNESGFEICVPDLSEGGVKTQLVSPLILQKWHGNPH
jgi:hypothetical protein